MSGIQQILMTSVGGIEVAISNQTASGQNLSGVGGTSVAGYRLNSTGQASKTIAGSYTNIAGEWLLSGSASSYEARGTFTLASGSGGTTSGPTTYTALSSTQTWTLSNTDNDSTYNVFIEIRPAGGGSVIDSATILLQALSAP